MDFNPQDLQRFLQEQWEGLWGGLLLVSLGPEARWFYHCLRDPVYTGYTLMITVRVKDLRRDIHGYTYRLPGREMTVQRRIGHHELILRRDIQDVAQMLSQTIEEMAWELGPMLYEWDPRIGWECQPPGFPGSESGFHTKPDWQACLVLDPRRIWYPQWEGYDLPGARPCCLCQKPFTVDWPIWGGGNVQWVHRECWGRGLQKMPRWTTLDVRLR